MNALQTTAGQKSAYDIVIKAPTATQTAGGPALELQIDKIKENPLKDSAQYRTERETNLSHFKELMNIFKMHTDAKSGQLSSAEFVRVFKEALGYLPDEQMMLLFMKIDINSDDRINWDDFSSYMLLQSEGQKLMIDTPSGEYDTENRKPVPTMHKEMIVRVRLLR
ncbi:EF-hand calcium binding domain 8 [Kappamyces sp. JEL0680]|nr:EF-hand calcium binding domain 8 [Kappamyces sp. JEL0680]